LKRIASILLLIVLLFNFIGYRFFSSYLEEKANAQLEAKLDQNDYSNEQLLSLKIPVTNLSYYNNSTQFERVDGQIEINGVQYKYVKRRIYNDSVELLCIPNHTAMSLRSAKDDFFKLVNDLQQTGQNKKTDPHASSKSFSVDNYTLNDSFSISSYSIVLSMQNNFSFSASITSCYSSTAEQPPEFC
jgi:hypothetical protein